MKTRDLTCAEVETCIGAYQRGQMSFAETQAVFEHLMACGVCHARYWRPWYQSGGTAPREEGDDNAKNETNAGTVTVSGNWTVETAYKLVAADTGTVARAYGLITTGGASLLVKASAVREDASSESSPPDPTTRTPGPCVVLGTPPSSDPTERAVAERLQVALKDLGLTPPWNVRTCLDFRFSRRATSGSPEQFHRDMELAVAVATASCVLEMPIPTDMVFTGGVAPDGTLLPGDAAQSPDSLARGTRLVCPAQGKPKRLKRGVTVRGCHTLAEVLDHAGTVEPPFDGPVWCTPTLEPGRAFPPADESVEMNAVTMVRLLATLPRSLVVIELDRAATGGIWWLILGGRVGIAAIGGPGSSRQNDGAYTCDSGTAPVEGAVKLWETIRGRLLDAGTVVSPGVDLWLDRFVDFADQSPGRFCTSVDRWPTNHPGDDPALPWLLKELGRTSDSAPPYLPFPMALELAKGLNEVHPDWFPPPVMEESGPESSWPDDVAVTRRDTSELPLDVSTHTTSQTPPRVESGEFAIGPLPAEPSVAPPRLDHLGVALPHVPLPKYLKGYYLELGEDGEIGPVAGIPVARIHVAVRRVGTRRRTTMRLEALMPGVTVDSRPIEVGKMTTLTGYHVVRYPGVQFRIEPARRDATGKRPCLALVMVPGKRFPLRGDDIRIGRDSRRCGVPLPDRQTIDNLVWTEKASRSDTVIVGRHRMKRAYCHLDGFEVGSEHASITQTSEGFFVKALRPFPVFILAVPPQPITAVGKHPVRIRHQDRLLIGHDLFQVILS